MTIELTPEQRWKAIDKNCWFSLGTNMKTVIESRKWPIYTGGRGIYIRDADGKEYINGSSCHCCLSLGHGNKQLIAAIEEQLEKIEFTPDGHSDASIRLCERIAELTPGDLNRVSLGVTGSDANEAAIAVARAYFRSKGKSNSMILSYFNVYHGATAGTVGLTSTLFPWGPKILQGRELADVTRGYYHFLPPLCYHCGYGLQYPSCDIHCARIVETVIRSMGPDNVMAFMAAPASTPSNVIVPPKEYWPIIRETCDKFGILLILDEVITGWGRTGELFASNYYGVIPDILTTAKGLSSSYMPISATVVRDYIFEALYGQPLPYYGHTASFHPVASACALAAIDYVMENKLVENAEKVGAHIMKRLKAMEEKSAILGDVRGLGLLIGIELVEDKKTRVPAYRLQRTFWEKCYQKGLYSDRDGIVPPLIITMAEADKVCDIIAESLAELEAKI